MDLTAQPDPLAPRAWPQPHRVGPARFLAPSQPLVRDVALAAGALVVSLLLLSRGGFASGETTELHPLAAALAAASTLPLVAWRRWPLGVFVVVTVLSSVVAGTGEAVGLPVGPAVALYLVAASRLPTHPWTRRTAIVVGVLCLTNLATIAAGSGQLSVLGVVHDGLALAAAWFAGERARLRRAHIADLEERATRVEHEAEQERRLAVSEERARIARDLHDSAGHSINVIALRAGTARLRYEHDPGRAHLALAAIEELARQTVAELDLLVGALRLDPAGGTRVDAPVGLASLGGLVAQHEAAGLAVTSMVSGRPRQLVPALDQAAYRILQEALTNAARHGTGEVGIDLGYEDGAVTVTVSNPVRPTTVRHPGGHGLIGMRERAGLLGGTVRAACRDGIFTVRAVLPDPEARP